MNNDAMTIPNPLILIVDDIPKNLQVLSNILNLEGYQIAFASNGRQALDVLQTALPDLILLDIMMPEMDGYEVCKKIKEDERLSDIPIIFLTGKAEQDDIVHGLKLGAVDYITKPFNAAELLSRVKTHVELKVARDRIVEYNKELELAKAQLTKLNAEKDKFFSIVAHDMRSPFTGFIGLTQLLSEEVENIEKDEIVTIASSMHKAANKLFSFLENLLEWSRSQMGSISLFFSQIDLKDAVNRIHYIFNETAAEKQITLINKIESVIYAKADNNTLNTILRNLTSNAIKFTKPGGTVEVDAEIYKEDKEYYLVSVKDSGIGMSEDTKSRLFRLDAKVTTPGTNNEQGTGLGLLLVKEFVEKNTGKIWLESERGVGTTIYFTIPIYKNSF